MDQDQVNSNPNLIPPAEGQDPPALAEDQIPLAPAEDGEAAVLPIANPDLDISPPSPDSGASIDNDGDIVDGQHVNAVPIPIPPIPLLHVLNPAQINAPHAAYFSSQQPLQEIGMVNGLLRVGVPRNIPIPAVAVPDPDLVDAAEADDQLQPDPQINVIPIDKGQDGNPQDLGPMGPASADNMGGPPLEDTEALRD